MNVDIRLLGRFEVAVEGELVPDDGWRRTQAAALVKMLALARDRQLHREQIIDALWPDLAVDEAAPRLHKAAHFARKALGTSDGIVLAGEAISLFPDATVNVDAHDFDQHASQAKSDADPDSAKAALLRYGGELLPQDVYESWTVDHRERLRMRHIELLRLAEDWEGLIAVDPIDEAAYVALMRASVEARDPRGAIRHFDRLHESLERELGVEPSDAAQKLRDDIEALINDGAEVDATPIGVAKRSRIPRPATSLIGRETELERLRSLAQPCRLVTIVGPGGTGKTRLVLELAAGFVSEGLAVIFVDLARVRDRTAVGHAFASALGVRSGDGRSAEDACVEYLESRELTLVIDNCEQVLEATTDLLDRVIRHCGSLRVIATSREPLGLPAEHVVRLAPLEVPVMGETRARELADFSAVRLFCERALAARGDAPIARSELAIVGDICRSLDGLPLAVELAATKLSAFDLSDLRDRLDRRLDLISGGRKAADERHRTLRSLVDWSYDLLDSEEQRLFRHLAVLAGGFDLQTVEDLADRIGLHEDPAALLGRLVDTSMVVRDRRSGSSRYVLLDTMAAYGIDQLGESDEADSAYDVIRELALEFTEKMFEGLDSAHEPEWHHRVLEAFDNLRVARRWALDRSDLETAVTLTWRLAVYDHQRGFDEIWDWCREVAAHDAVLDTTHGMNVLGSAARAGWMLGDLDQCERSAADAMKLPGGDTNPFILDAAAAAALFRGEHEKSIDLWIRAADLDARLAPIHLASAAHPAGYSGRVDVAREAIERAERGVEASGSLSARAWVVYARAETCDESPEEAERLFQEAIETAREVGASFTLGVASVSLVSIYMRLGQTEQALEGFADLIGYWERSGAWTQQWTTLRNAAELFADFDEFETAALVLLAADRASEAALVIGDAAERRQALLDRLEAELGTTEWARINKEVARATRTTVAARAREAIDRLLEA